MSTYEQITTERNRRCRAETILRLLISTSFPHATLTDLTLMFTKHSGQTDPEELERNAIDLKEIEKSYTLMDFVRCIEIKRTLGELVITAKCLDIEPNMRTIVDNTKTHQVMAATTIQLARPDQGLEDPEAIAIRLMELFYRSQIKSKHRAESIDHTEWRCRVKQVEIVGDVKTTKNLDSVIDVKQAIHKLSTSLRKKSFSITVAQRCILLTDQKSRLFGVTKK